MSDMILYTVNSTCMLHASLSQLKSLLASIEGSMSALSQELSMHAGDKA